MGNHNNTILYDINQAREPLNDVVGYFECFDSDKIEIMLSVIAMIFKKTTLYIVAQDDDSFKIINSEKWQPDIKLKKYTLIGQKPWIFTKGKPLLWSWILYNQQGYMDGLQFEFAYDATDESTVIQLVAIGSEIKLREVAKKCESIKMA